jgi:hypothetical protein
MRRDGGGNVAGGAALETQHLKASVEGFEGHQDGG